ncbi:MAG: nicotinate-nucleotide adenylyltransferase [Zymomonas mobilis subsp. pomaceae]|uniref:Probable nicotinate-nucleotide adenylyltransferase n=1 Tax=Zymomonas mobilis subsp. pomaceae (strain ATCC 29192 / DSM 22645 / JCM 10191 / CCUG 17912 / NBRC 13757 / NCIMB 11200 / NRRL B-4491 / Barker I) TaxID=579138 RepID=F8EVK6_ZYMMT|nr:nicotinate-nucleotide adenylyltransferase [Zymomonas mobilis]AEI38343.1 Nicotinate-nucleotide adenylyltransferase [Zymomonas mobilis subsp. pomaceae ATCC 29192]MDX5948032.1 nicotinate-nucleotide adenylyltransferase [Zymomonas mobilis subsp. pomaceae]GEB89362.1 putative nicotinate-nucleotide adenylyltransferase [Zymomonas mobilis subsp. pomaceae]
MKKLTGLLGGSFNPAHQGHRHISLLAKKALGLDEIWWMVSPGNPLKSQAKDMASLSQRFASARRMTRYSPIKVTAIERDLHCRFTVDTLRRLIRRYPNRRFVWLMGMDNLKQFQQWKNWQQIARMVVIAVIARPSYDNKVHAVRAMSWLRRFVRPASRSLYWTDWRPPALVLLRFRPDPSSATVTRARQPDWHKTYSGRGLRDAVTWRPIS